MTNSNSNSITGRKVLVTGAGGFIGSFLTDMLVARGARVRAFVRYNSRQDHGLLRHLPAPVRDEVEIVSGDLRDAPAVLAAMRGTDVVFHLGAIISIPYSYGAPDDTVGANVLGTLNVLNAARAAGACVIHTSTSEVYGTAQYVPMDEAHPLQGQSPYSASKIGADKIAESYHRSYGLPVVTIRPFNTFGPRQSTRAVIPTIITQALSGGRVTLGNTTATRDFTYVTDTAAGFILAAETPAAIGRTINLGTGREVTVRDTVTLVQGIMGTPLTIIESAERRRPDASEVQRLCSDNSLAREVLGWSPAVTFEEGLERTVRWLETSLGEYGHIGSYTI